MKIRIDHQALIKNKMIHFWHSVALLGGMVALLSLLGWLFAGPSGMWWIMAAGVASLILSPKISPHVIMKWHAARRLPPQNSPFLYTTVGELARRAGLPTAPTLYIVPHRGLNAFTTGSHDNAAIAVTAGLIQWLNRREMAAVLAHEISHLKNNDLWMMNLSGILGRVTGFFSMMGQLLLIINLPVMLVTNHHLPWAGILVLIFAPALATLLQLAVSRTREFSADLSAAELTGDPRGLASALSKIDAQRDRWLGRLFFPAHRPVPPSFLQSHPQTEERIKRLLSLSNTHMAPTSREGVRAGNTRLPDRVHVPPAWRLKSSWR